MNGCPSCNRHEVGEIDFAGVGEGVAFNYCRHCEHRWWVAGDRNLSLNQVLEVATVLSRA